MIRPWKKSVLSQSTKAKFLLWIRKMYFGRCTRLVCKNIANAAIRMQHQPAARIHTETDIYDCFIKGGSATHRTPLEHSFQITFTFLFFTLKPLQHDDSYFANTTKQIYHCIYLTVTPPIPMTINYNLQINRLAKKENVSQYSQLQKNY